MHQVFVQQENLLGLSTFLGCLVMVFLFGMVRQFALTSLELLIYVVAVWLNVP